MEIVRERVKKTPKRKEIVRKKKKKVQTFNSFSRTVWI
jgi:hypothetical protein